jgi:hypothetical protein
LIDVDSIYAKKTKTHGVFWFLAFETKKLGKTRKQSFESKPNMLLKVLFFWLFGFPGIPKTFFVFSRVFAALVILDIYLLYKISEALMFT